MVSKTPETLKEKIQTFRKDPVMMSALVAAVVSVFIVPPSKAYLHYINFCVIGLLFSLMVVVAGFKRAGALDILANKVLRTVENARQLAFVLIGLCFFSSMFITNDVALITFVPLTIIIISKTGNTRLLIFVIVMQNLAANMGSILTPFGSPQNLYVFTKYDMTNAEFMKLMSVPFIISAIYIFILTMKVKNVDFTVTEGINEKVKKSRKFFIWLALFMMALMSVLRLIPSWTVVVLCIAAALMLERKIFIDINYNLLLTFVFLFIFTGNIASIPEVHDFLYEYIEQRTFLLSLLLSQFVSNVPSTMLLAKFTDDYRALLIGADIAGLGTLIGSIASIISFQLYAETEGAEKGRFLKVFTLVNLVLLAIMIPVMMLYLKYFNYIF